MLPIFFLAFAFIYQLSTASAGSSSIYYYDAVDEQQVQDIQKWYNLVKGPLDNKIPAIKQLGMEATSKDGKMNTKMNDYLSDAYKHTKRCKTANIPTLSQEECLVVMMYTGAFYAEYNEASRNRNWAPYRVYTTLLLSALQKLAKANAVASGTTVYRGIKFSLDQLTSGRIFWSSFTSTSLNENIAETYVGGDGQVITFLIQDSKYAARIPKPLSNFDQEEVLLPPFQAFDVVRNEKGKIIRFETSKTQKFLMK